MNFTKEDFEKIATYLRRTGIRDTELREAESTLDNTSIPVVQDGENRQMSAQTFVEQVTVEASEYAGQFKTVNGEPIVGEGNIDAQEVYYCAVTDSTICPVSRTTSGWAIVPNETITPAKNKWYVDVISGKVYYYNGNGLTEFHSGSGTVTGVKIGSDGNVIEPENGIIELPAPQEVDLSDYVVKEDSKGLSTNDYTDADKTKLQNLPTADGLTQQLNSKANASDVVKSISVNGAQQQKDSSGNVNIQVQAGGESIVFDTEGTPIIDSPLSPNADTVLGAASARWVKEIDNNVKAILAALAGIAFTSAKPTWEAVAKRKYNLAMTALTGCTGEVVSGDAGNGQVYEGGVRIKLTPTQASYAFTSVTVNGESATTTSADDGLGSVYLDIVVNGNITVAATATQGRSISLSGTNSTHLHLTKSSIPVNTTVYEDTLSADTHWNLPDSITVQVGSGDAQTLNSATITSETSTGYDKNTGAIKISGVDGDITITAVATEDSHATLDLSSNSFDGEAVEVKRGTETLADDAHLYENDIITILPKSGKLDGVTAEYGSTPTPITLGGNVYEGLTFTVTSSHFGEDITIEGDTAALSTFSISISGVTSDVGITWNTPSSAPTNMEITEGSAFSVTLAKVSGTGVLNISTSTMGSETIQPNNGTIATNHVTGDITIAAHVEVVYNLTENLEDCQSDFGGSSILGGTFTAHYSYVTNSGYTGMFYNFVPRVIMGGNDITWDVYSFDTATGIGTVNIPNVTDDVVVNIAAVVIVENSKYIANTSGASTGSDSSGHVCRTESRIPISPKSKSFYIYYGFPSTTTGNAVMNFYDSNNAFIDYFGVNYTNGRSITIDSDAAAYALLSLYDIDNCYLRYSNGGRYIWKGNNVE